MPSQSSHQPDYYPDTKSEATYVDDDRMPTPWEGQVHELRDRVTNPYPTRPRDYCPSDDYIRQLRNATSDYGPQPSKRPNKVYATLCCGSRIGIAAWAVTILGIAIAIGILLVKALVWRSYSFAHSRVLTLCRNRRLSHPLQILKVRLS